MPSSHEVRFAAIGDVHGSFVKAAGAVRAATTALGGHCDFVLSVGDLEANRNARDAAGVATGGEHRRWTGEFPRVLSGAVSFDVPVYFIGGEREPWAALDVAGPGEWGPNIVFLGRAGVSEVGGLSVAFLSGIRGEVTPGSLGDRQGRDEKGCFLQVEVLALQRALARSGGADVLVVHDWPLGLDGDWRAGDSDLRSLCYDAGAKLVLCGHRHRRFTGEVDGAPVEALGDILDGDDGWAAFIRRGDGTIERVDRRRRSRAAKPKGDAAGS